MKKSGTDKKVCGVCGGIAEYFGISPFVVRLITVLLCFTHAGFVIIYFLLAAIMDEP